MPKFQLAALALAATLLAPPAWALGRGTGIYSLQLASSTADLYSPPGGPYLSAYTHSEAGARFEYWRLLSDDYAFTFAAGAGWFGETDKPGSAAGAGAPDHKYTQSSWMARIGGDRVAKVGERAVLFFGPGLEYWNGKATFDGILAPGKSSTQNVNRFSVDGRIGGHMMITPHWAVTGHIGERLGYATVSDKGATASWWPGSTDAALGISLFVDEK